MAGQLAVVLAWRAGAARSGKRGGAKRGAAKRGGAKRSAAKRSMAKGASTGGTRKRAGAKRSSAAKSSSGRSTSGSSGGRTVSIAEAEVLSRAAIADPSTVLVMVFTVFPLNDPPGTRGSDDRSRHLPRPDDSHTPMDRIRVGSQRSGKRLKTYGPVSEPQTWRPSAA